MSENHNFPKVLLSKIEDRVKTLAVRNLGTLEGQIDFCSNDYLGFAKNELIFDTSHQLLLDNNFKINGATGSRLISGNHKLFQIAESLIAQFHKVESALIFNSGYDANLGFFSCVPQRGDVIIYDEYCHASIRDGIKLGNAKSYKYTHNDIESLESKLSHISTDFNSPTIYVVTESVFSMDGDSPNLEVIAEVCKKYNAFLIIDEAHSIGVSGDYGEGLAQYLNLNELVFARIITFGKALGCHGAAILGPQILKQYLINFTRSFIYTTGLSPHSIATIIAAYNQLNTNNSSFFQLKQNIHFFNQHKLLYGLKPLFIYSKSAIHCAIIPGNENAINIANKLKNKGLDVKAILSPTVPLGQERLRICLHSYNTFEEIQMLIIEISKLVFS